MIDRINEQPFCQTRVSGSTFVNADCFDVFPFIEDKSIDAIICDLPYGTTACKWDTILPFNKLWKEYERVIKPNGAIVLFGSQPFTSALVMSNPKIFKYSWIWIKNSGADFMMAKNKPLNRYEDILVFSKANFGTDSRNRMEYYPQDLISVNKKTLKNNTSSKNFVPNRTHKIKETLTTHSNYPINVLCFDKDGKEHPTQKPLELLEYLVKTYTNEGDTVLDNTMGSGTTNLACIKLNRKSIGIEKEKQYYDVAVRRASEYCMEKLISHS